VNNQMVVGTLMNICDNPTQISIGQGWMEDEVLRRIPIVVTGGWGRVGGVSCRYVRRAWVECGLYGMHDALAEQCVPAQAAS
jgi:hypothetical protein